MDDSTISALVPPGIAKVAACAYLALLLIAKLRDSSFAFLPLLSNSHRQMGRLRRELELLELSRKIAEEKKALQSLGVHEVQNTSLMLPSKPNQGPLEPVTLRRSLEKLEPPIDEWPIPFRYLFLFVSAGVGAYGITIMPLGLALSVVSIVRHDKWAAEGPMVPIYLLLTYGSVRLLRWANGKNKKYLAKRRDAR